MLPALASFLSFYWCSRARVGGINLLCAASLLVLGALLGSAVTFHLRPPCPPLEQSPTPRRAGAPSLLLLPLAPPQQQLQPLLPAATAPHCAFLHAQEAAVFLHVYPANAWRMILDDTVAALQASPLRACGVRFLHGLPAAQWPYTGSDAAFYSYHAEGAAASAAAPSDELDTLTALHGYCQAHPQAVVSYIHGKGTRFPAETDFTRFVRQWDWRRLHLYFLVEAPQGCLAALASGAYDTCGVNRRRTAFFTDQPRPHYTGNFWWARCEYVRTLPRPTDFAHDATGEEQHYAPEMWLGSSGRVRMFSCFDSGIEHYQHEYSRANYVGARCAEDLPEGKG